MRNPDMRRSVKMRNPDMRRSLKMRNTDMRRSLKMRNTQARVVFSGVIKFVIGFTFSSICVAFDYHLL